MKLAVIIPARNEEHSITATLQGVAAECNRHRISAEIIVVNDQSTDRTVDAALGGGFRSPRLMVLTPPRQGFGRAIRAGLTAAMNSDATHFAIFMADGSDDPVDLVKCFQTAVKRSSQVVMGSRWIEGSKVTGYPAIKLGLNRAANWLIQYLWPCPYNDVTNAFKVYRRDILEQVLPLQSRDFAILVELPIKCINRWAAIDQVPISWTGRKHGVSKFRLVELSWRYLITLLWVYLERVLWD